MRRTLLFFLVITGILALDWITDTILYPENRWYDTMLAICQVDYLFLFLAGTASSLWADWLAWRERSRSARIGDL